ncbi:MAG: hypothetical protein ACXVA2_14910, partial [Mucilaginibacter sp.]
EKKLEFLVSALCVNARANMCLGELELAARQLKRAFPLARTELQHSILLFQYELPQKEEARQYLVKQAAQIVIDNNLCIPKSSDNFLELNKSRLAINLSLLDKFGFVSEFDRLARYIAEQVFDKKMAVAEALLDLYDSIDSEEKRSPHIALLERAMARNYFDEVTDSSARLRMLRFVTVYSNAPQTKAWRIQYIESLGNQAEGDVTEDDFIALLHIGTACFHAKAHPLLEKIFTLRRYLEKQSLELSRQLNIAFSYYEMEFLSQTGKKKLALKMAKQVVILTDKVEASGSQENVSEFASEIRRRALALISKVPMKRNRSLKIGRKKRR